MKAAASLPLVDVETYVPAAITVVRRSRGWPGLFLQERRGFDGEVNINELFDSSLANLKTRFILGGSFVSKYQSDQNPDYVLPENVGAYGGRAVTIVTADFGTRR